MSPATFREIFDAAAARSGLVKHRSIWRRDFPETTVVLQLQRSSSSSLYYLNIKVWLSGLTGRTLTSQEMVTSSGDVFRREPVEMNAILDLESEVSDADRARKIEQAFPEILVPLIERLSTGSGLLRAAGRTPPEVFLLPNIKTLLLPEAPSAV